MRARCAAVTDLIIPGYSICLALLEHIPSLSAIELQAAQMLKGYAPDSVLAETTDSATFEDAVRRKRLWVALTGNRPVGFALVKMLADDLPHLEEIDVAPSHGRRGLGAALVRAACEWATVSGYAALTLTTFRAVLWNYRFYSRMGFVEVPRKNLRKELAAVVSEETHRGLDPAARVVMEYRCGSLAIGEPRKLVSE
jgi:4-diphosphocytidyl-2-C-methyl-D-erythritol kinase